MERECEKLNERQLSKEKERERVRGPNKKNKIVLFTD